MVPCRILALVCRKARTYVKQCFLWFNSFQKLNQSEDSTTAPGSLADKIDGLTAEDRLTHFGECRYIGVSGQQDRTGMTGA